MNASRLLPLLLLAAAAAPAVAAESAYPNRPIRVIVGFPPSGSADIFARLMGQQLTDAWGQSVVVDNRPGAGSTIGSEIVANSTPDGYTLMVVSASFSTSAGLYTNLKYDPVKSFQPITVIASAPNVCLAHPAVPVKNVGELVAAAKSHPRKFNMGSAGTGSITHLSGELFTSMAGIEVQQVPYKGGGPALQAVVANQIQLTFLSLSASLGQVKAGRVKALGVTSAKRSQILPDVPAIAEFVPGYQATNWFAMLAPAAVPKPIIDKINKQAVAILRTPEVAGAIRKQGAEPEGGSPEETAKFVRGEIAKWSKVIKSIGLKAN
ncbi:MAG: tripartite tricarboxylate transporter substrate binding protein [Burkholderiales bacterium]